jgi:preprotein translocase subunit SecG
MSTILIVVVLLLLFGGGGGYYAHSQYGGAGLGGVLGTVLAVLLVFWLVGALRFT